MATFDIVLPVSKPVIFPRRCVVCEKPDPDGSIAISVLGAGTAPVLEMVSDQVLDGGSGQYGGGNTSNRINGIPACKSCAFGLRWYHRIFKFLTYTAWIPGLILIVLNKVPVWVSVTFMLICVLVPPVLTLIFPPAFGATFINDSANFEFRSKKVAEEFMYLNGAVPVVKEAPVKG